LGFAEFFKEVFLANVLSLFLIVAFYSLNLRAQVTPNPCDELHKEENDPSKYPLSKAALYCIAWGEINAFDRDSGQGTPVHAGWTTVLNETALVIACRNRGPNGAAGNGEKGKGLIPGQINCMCPPGYPPTATFIPFDGEASRQWDDMKNKINQTDNNLASASEARVTNECNGNYFFYHDKEPYGDYPVNKGDYMTQDLGQKTKEKEANSAAAGHPGKFYVEHNLHGGKVVHVYFPHNEDFEAGLP
jgi:hypothetical protein